MLQFSKYSGLGNDFLFIEGEPLSREAIVQLCNRHEGVGADGIFFYREGQATIFNSDGSNPSLCGNGLRCLFHHLHRIGMQREVVHIGGRTYRGKVLGPTVSVELGKPTIHLRKAAVAIAEKPYCVDLIDTGVPHFIVRDPHFPFEREAKTLRFHPSAPEGANVNWFLHPKVRTYERGCEEETQACGTGIAACAYSLHIEENVPFPITLLTARGKPLRVDWQEDSLWLEGEATFIFQGEINLDILVG